MPVQVLYGDTLFPGAVLAGGSQQTASIGASIAFPRSDTS
jgi:xanthine dehydrogenase YagR molybdenum-binding subunit